MFFKKWGHGSFDAGTFDLAPPGAFAKAGVAISPDLKNGLGKIVSIIVKI